MKLEISFMIVWVLIDPRMLVCTGCGARAVPLWQSWCQGEQKDMRTSLEALMGSPHRGVFAVSGCRPDDGIRPLWGSLLE
eukprot:3655218-Amphidinium_carterae.1